MKMEDNDFNREEERRYQRYKFDREENDREYECEQQGKTYVRGYMKEDGTYVHGYCREMTPQEREDYIQRAREFQEMMKKYPKKKTLKGSYAMGGGDYVDVYEPMNPIEDIIGGEVRFRSSSGRKKRRK